MKQQKEDCVLKEEKTRHYLEAVISVAEHISRERDQLLHMVIVMLPILWNDFGFSDCTNGSTINTPGTVQQVQYILDHCHFYHCTEIHCISDTAEKAGITHDSADTTDVVVSATIWLDHMMIC